MLIYLGIFVVGHTHNLDTTDREASLFEGFSLNAGEEVFALFKMPSWKAPAP